MTSRSWHGCHSGRHGASRTRTGDLLVANQTLSQLSYGPASYESRAWSCDDNREPVANVLFVCLHNAGRSQMSQALFEREAGGRHHAASAGTDPVERVHPEVVEAMREVGLDVSKRRPTRLTRERAEWADLVVTMGCGDECPYVPGRRYLDWDLPDPSGRPLDEIRSTRDAIASRVRELVQSLDPD
jgi:arsenate reductase